MYYGSSGSNTPSVSMNSMAMVVSDLSMAVTNVVPKIF
jgi:hypothetical protein